MLDPAAATDSATTSERILAATSEVLARNGVTKLSLSDVAQQAGVSRPTLYRWFSSKEALLDAFGEWEHQQFRGGISAVTAGLRGAERLDAVLRFIVGYQQSYYGVRMIDIEPAHVIGRMAQAIPVMQDSLEKLIAGPRAAIAAATAVRVAVAHYIVGSDDAEAFLDQLRQAVGIASHE